MPLHGAGCRPEDRPAPLLGDLGIGERRRRMLVRGLEDSMPRPRAADDFETIRSRMEELRREKLPGQPTPTGDTKIVGHRGPCACGHSLVLDECDGSCKAL